MSSRLIVKNLPRKITRKQLEEHFSKLGTVTDAKLALTRSGAFRRFAFVGYSSEEEAEKAARYFNKTFINSSRIEVELARPIGDELIPRPWSKYSKGSSAFRTWEKNRQNRDETQQLTREARERKDKQQRLNQDIHKSKLAQLLGEFYQLESDPNFVEFLETHKPRSKVQTWSNDAILAGREEVAPSSNREKQEGEKKARVRPSLTSVESKRPGGRGILLTRMHLKFDNEEESKACSDSSAHTLDLLIEDGSGVKEDTSHKASLSDMDYLRLKMVHSREDECHQHEAVEDDNQDNSGVVEEKRDDDSDDTDNVVEKQDDDNPLSESHVTLASHTVKMRGLPFEAGEEDIRTFFYPLKVVAIRMLYDPQDRPLGYAFVDFASGSDLKDALRRNRDCMGNRYIELFRDEGQTKEGYVDRKKATMKPWEVKASKETSKVDPVSESGRLFLRNLPYTITEDDLTKKFESFGPLTEVSLPLDKNTNQPIGLAFITFMLPEHAVKAYHELDGKILRGRLLHILPAKEKKIEEEEAREKSSYKKKKEKKTKAEAGSSHNWNALFLGANAVADAMAERYQTKKSDVLDAESSQSLAVRMALGETQLVAETREFLEEQGVQLALFQKQGVKRSKTVILAKNLPYGTRAQELCGLFSQFGSLRHVILPPAGISALVEFLDPGSARAAFMKLAYSKFKHLPLYLEWAPVGIITDKPEAASKDTEVASSSGEAASKDTEVASSNDSSSCTVFVKNLNFKTDDDSLRTHFSRLGSVKSCSVARKMSTEDPKKLLSLGYGFVEFSSHQFAATAVPELHLSELDGHKIELEMSRKSSFSYSLTGKTDEQKSAKILVRNVPFEASQKEVRQLFSTFGTLKIVRFPKKLTGQGEHRGFGFVEYVTKEDAHRAFESLGRSTHLYGRRLVLEWAEEEESIDDVRKRTAKHFHEDTDDGEGVVPKKLRGLQLLASLKSSRD